MITSISQLTMHQYIELVCGDTSVLHKKYEIIGQDKLEEMRKHLMFEFATLSNETSAKSIIIKSEKQEYAKAKLLLFQICNNLYALEDYDSVRKILFDYGINTYGFDNKKLYDEIDQLIKRARVERLRMKDDNHKDDDMPSASEIRRSYDKQTASLMTYFKFQIDIKTIPASQYACMIDQANKEIKARINAMSKR